MRVYILDFPLLVRFFLICRIPVDGINLDLHILIVLALINKDPYNREPPFGLSEALPTVQVHFISN